MIIVIVTIVIYCYCYYYTSSTQPGQQRAATFNAAHELAVQ